MRHCAPADIAPAGVMDTVTFAGTTAKLAVNVRPWSIITVRGLSVGFSPAVVPDQPVNVYPPFGVALAIGVEPAGYHPLASVTDPFAPAETFIWKLVSHCQVMDEFWDTTTVVLVPAPPITSPVPIQPVQTYWVEPIVSSALTALAGCSFTGFQT